ncbi:MAG: type II toxin-antitoxin system PemK/MazF family toxin [Sulfobacillus sp.]
MQSDFFKEHPSVTVCLITSDLRDAPLFRLTLHPSAANRLEKPSQIMVDKLVTVSREKIRDISGHLEDKSMAQVNRTLAMWVGLGLSTASSAPIICPARFPGSRRCPGGRGSLAAAPAAWLASRPISTVRCSPSGS